jgi:hypothetical protein
MMVAWIKMVGEKEVDGSEKFGNKMNRLLRDKMCVVRCGETHKCCLEGGMG